MLGGRICRPRVNGLARVFVVIPIKFIVGVRHALIAPQGYDIRVHAYTYSKLPRIIFPYKPAVSVFSVEEAGRYLETYKSFEKKPPDLIMEKTEANFLAQVS